MKKKIIFVHCHPDDETITNGLSIPKFIKDGHEVTVINFSGGESGNSYLIDFPSGTKEFRDKLLQERERALDSMGVTHRIFIGPYHDSMPKLNPSKKECLLNQDIEKLSYKLNQIFIDIKPDIVITYDKHGWSGHPDHKRIHQVVLSAVKLCDADYRIPEVWFTVIPNDKNPKGITPKGEVDLFWVSSYEKIDLEIDCSDVIDKKINALKQYETQIKLFEDYWCLVGMESYKVPFFTREWFNIYRGFGIYDS
jgi:N-acetyl-1-D-myo-inositol-2-amino-2-deoxy-alpha-D-glucopyranoside deacetylase